MASDQPCHFWKLPQEIHDMIFKLAYAVEHRTGFVTRDKWNQREKEKRQHRGPQYRPREFSDHKVNDFMGSKQYFVNAAQAWSGAQCFSMMSSSPRFISYSLLEMGLVTRYCTSMHVYFSGYWGLHRCVSLKTIRIRVRPETIETSHLCPWFDQYTDGDFAALEDVKNTLSAMPRTLHEINIEIMRTVSSTAEQWISLLSGIPTSKHLPHIYAEGLRL